MTKFGACKAACAVLLLCATTTIIAQAQTFKTVLNFDGSNGAYPYLMSMVQGMDGNLYGTTQGGGANNVGTVFRLNEAGKLKVLYSFCSQVGCPDGYQPFAGLVLATDGNFYGTTDLGGDVTCPFYGTCGTVFKITHAATLTTLFSFDEVDGELPMGKIVEGSNGELYGTTSQGGMNNLCGGEGCGTIFKITSDGALTTLHSFGISDGQGPFAGLIEGTDGKFYGTTDGGGTHGDGTAFRITAQGTLTTLHSFAPPGDGSAPYEGLIQGTDGNFYGTTIGGGYPGWGIVFKMNSSGTLTVLHSFDLSDGGEPYSLMQGSDGNFYGTTYYGGNLSCGAPYGCGTVFQLTPSGVLTTLHSFQSSDGVEPTGGLVQATNGIFYGTTYRNGAHGDGTIFNLDMGLGPFVTFVLAAGKVGQTGGILGQGFTGTTGVSLNGIPASFTVISDTFIRATVPAGATTGYVTVTTPSGTLSSNVPFHVIR
jgi:uncharacterized repeat protein (TIGR03803 family)